MRSNVKFGARLHDWYEAMMTCYEHLSDSELQDLRDWEQSPAFTRTGDWPGWLRYIGARPGEVVQQRPVLVQRRA
jgi:hypothetical protein